MPQKGFSIAGLLQLRNKAEAQGRLGERQPVAIIDIGSNSVRQVVYEGLTRAPSILFNEKVLCGLGADLAKTGELSKEAIERTLKAIERFTLVGRQLNVEETHILATAASREASNGSRFIKKVEKLTGKTVKLLSGAEEAQFAFYGIKAGFHEPEGIAGDLGGGSTELVPVGDVKPNGITTPLGGLRLLENSGGDPNATRKIAKKEIRKNKIKWPSDRRTFYAIGGTWRSLSRLHMLETKHPVEVVHGFSVSAEEYKKFCDAIISDGADGFKHIDEISKNRRNLLPYGAAVMSELIEHLGIETISTSAVGLREGYLYSLLDEELQKRDALLEATAELSLLRARSPAHCQELGTWTNHAFKVLDLGETKRQKRWRLAACNLADIVWRSASDFRAEQTLGIINNAGINSISHEGRAYLALVTFHRYQGLGPKKEPPETVSLASKKDIKLARILAAFFRLLYLFSAAESGVLPDIKFERAVSGKPIIRIPQNLVGLLGEKPMQRLEHLSREIGETIEVVTDK